MAVFLLALVWLAPLPLGGARPVVWTALALLVAFGGTVYVAVALAYGFSLRVPLRRYILPGALYAGLLLFCFAQTIPIGGIVFTSASGQGLRSATLSLTPGATLLSLVKLSAYGIFFFLMLQVAANARRATWLLTTIFLSTVLQAGLGLLFLTQFGDTIMGIPKWAYEGVATGSFVNRNSFATYLAMGLVAGTSLLISRLTAKQQPGLRGGETQIAVTGLGLALVAAGLIASQSRMGTLAGLLGCALVLFWALWRLQISFGRWLLILGVVGGLAALLLTLYGNGLFERLGSLENSADVRGALYQQIVHMIAARPLLGYGGDSFELAFPLFHELPVSPDLLWDKAHSTYLSLWSDYGLVFGSVPLLILCGFAVYLLRLALNRSAGAVHLAGLGVLLVAGVHSLTDFSLEIEGNIYLFLALLALAMGAPASRLSLKEGQE
jgi:O-antigen ligase